MEIGFDPQNWKPDAARVSPDHATGRPDWHGLRARLFASRAARGALLGQYQAVLPVEASGSFDPGSARRLSAFAQTLPGVNPVSLADGKPDPVKVGAIAEEPSSGERG